ncbi:formylglycine-generating enzyme family protein [Pyxidicoccus sp. 3LG]
MGEFELVLEPRDFEPARQQWARARGSVELDWTLAPAGGTTHPEGTAPYQEPELRRSHRRREADGSLRERVEAPSREAWLTVRRGDCPPSVMRLQKLPGYAERSRDELREVRIPVPTCAASRAGMVRIPAGPYWRPADKDPVRPEQLVEVGDFAVDLTEVTNGQFRLFENEVLPRGKEERVPPPDLPIFSRSLQPGSPVTGVDAFAAESFCLYMGKVLPTYDEWHKAFRGGLTLDAEGRIPNPDPRRGTVWLEAPEGPPANLLDVGDPYEGVAPVGSFPGDRSPYGLLDLAGNVAEWTGSTEAQGKFRNLRIASGGRWDSPVKGGHHEASWSNHLPPRRFEFAIGMRCVERPGVRGP